jgi:hypothetical protein
MLEPSPPIMRSILNKERGGTPKRMPNLDEPSPIITTHLKIRLSRVATMPSTASTCKMKVKL